MPTPTYTALANITLGSSASSVTFSSIPATYRDLVLISNNQFTTSESLQIRVNGDTGTNYAAVRASGLGSDSYSALNRMAIQVSTYPSTSLNAFVIQFMDYSATDKHKTVLARPNSASTEVGMEAHRWANTAAITTILVYTGANFTAGSTFALYGIAS